MNAAYDNIIWNTWFTSNSEEVRGNHKTGQPSCGSSSWWRHILNTGAVPDALPRKRRPFLLSWAYTGPFAGKISVSREARDVLDGRLPDGSEIPVFSFDELKRGICQPAEALRRGTGLRKGEEMQEWLPAISLS